MIANLLGYLASADAAWLIYAATALLAYLECAAFVGLVAPGESFVSLAGFLASRGQVKLAVLFPIVIVSAILGDITGYLLGRKYGEAFFTSSHRILKVPPELIASAHDFFQRHGGKTMLIARFVGFLRSIAPFLAGSARSSFVEFIIFDSIGAAAWATTFLLLGYFLGAAYVTVEKYLGRAGFILALLVIAIWAAVALVRRYRLDFSAIRQILTREVLFFGWFTAGALLLVALVDEAVDQGLYGLERSILLAIHRLSTPILDRLAIGLTSLGSGFVVAAVVVIAFVVLWKRLRDVAYQLAGTVATGLGLGYLLSYLIQRPRPAFWPHLVDVRTFSFPSNHTTAAAVTYWFLAWVIFREVKGGWRWASLVFALLPFVVGFTRLYLGVHWVTDVLGGYALSLLALSPWLYVYERGRERRVRADEEAV
jgi:undecaprenyl-diphosphatase